MSNVMNFFLKHLVVPPTSIPTSLGKKGSDMGWGKCVIIRGTATLEQPAGWEEQPSGWEGDIETLMEGEKREISFLL